MSFVSQISRSTIPVLISGAGPSGLTAALILLRSGVNVRVIDKLPAFNPGCRGPGLQPRTLELFHQAGLHEIVESAQRLIPIRMYKPGTMEPARDVMMSQPHAPTAHFPYGETLILGQNRTEHLLREQLAKHDVHVELSTELLSFEQDEEGVVVQVAKKQGGHDIPETIHAQFLLGADGARSVVRKGLGCSFLGETRQDTRLMIGDVRLAGEGLDREHWHSFGDMKSKAVLLNPIHTIGSGEDGFQLMAGGIDVDIGATIAAGQEAIYDLIQELLPVKVDFRELIWVNEFRPNIRMTDKFSDGRVFIAGDAAHCHSPTGAQGLNSSVQDAFNLAWKMALVVKGLSPRSLLDTYTPERLPVIAEMLNLTTSILNRAATQGADRSWERPDRLRMLGVNYRSSPIVLDEVSAGLDPVPAYGDANNLEGGAPLVAGDRAPDAPGLLDAERNKHRMFDIFEPTRHTVLIFAPTPENARPMLEALDRQGSGRDKWTEVVSSVVVLPAGATVSDGRLEGVLLLEDAEGFAYAGFSPGEGETHTVVVRPDGYIGAVGRSIEGIKRYLEQIFA
ncbi:hypothetical protein CONPUDRAFT_166087 [Coniophora puteana RWD-64-598 SS2]|uniref:FAD-binding domain-containing protein n=1 Tax=Coniophora puteana (strain RWD-64-598) TaxID=741705 RepID=A0A5M3MNI5_CONPW|nr:uncharacterized protein CONPUDRAFT_166087 [Coniophora puteana RWD-64-598 SS2]EIW80606.1 hypothetical protein CONPUDRAFT_166087 [Coniophora puteana RWD-64-598 SS2]